MKSISPVVYHSKAFQNAKQEHESNEKRHKIFKTSTIIPVQRKTYQHKDSLKKKIGETL